MRYLASVVWIVSAVFAAVAGAQSVDPLGPPVATFRVDVFEILRDVTATPAGVDVIDFERFPEGTALGKVTTRTNTVTLAVGSGPTSSGFVAGVGMPQTAFNPGDSPTPSTHAGARFLTDEPRGPSIGNDYFLKFANPIVALTLDLYDFRADGGPGIGDTAILKVYADDNYKTLVGQAIYKVEGRELDQNVVRMKVRLDCVSARTARLQFSRPDIGTGIDNVTFETATPTMRPDAFGKLPHGDGFRPLSSVDPVAPPLNHSLVSRCYTANLREHARAGKVGITPLMLSGAAGDEAVLQRLIRAGADPNARDSTGWTALMYSSIARGPATLQALLAAGADPNARSAAGQTAIMAAATLDNPLSFLKALIDARADVNAQDADGFTPLMLTGDRAAIEMLLAAKADPNLRSAAGQTAAMLNAGPSDSSRERLRLLLNSGADINAQDNAGQTALMLLVMGRSPTIGFESLISDGGDIKKISDVVSLLKSAGARADLRDASGLTVTQLLEREQATVLADLERVAKKFPERSVRDARAKITKWYASMREILEK
jgi:ankyrin repeat protein